MKIYPFFIALLLSSFPLSAQWNQLDSGTNAWLRGVWFISPNEGIVVGNAGTIIKTYDGGETWEPVESNTTVNLFSVFFANEEIGYATGSSGTVVKTYDRGESWETVRQGPAILHSAYFMTPELGFVSGDVGIVNKTEDGGATWEGIDVESINGKVSIFFLDENLGYFAGVGFEDAIVRTTDGGETFERVYSAGGIAQFTAIHFTNEQNGFACSTAGDVQIARTSDGGNTWVKNDMQNDIDFFAIDFIDDTEGLMVGGLPTASVILRTLDGGITWSSENPNTTNPLFDVFMTSSETAYAVGLNGTILRSGQFVNTQELAEESIRVFPNPFTAELNIVSELDQPLHFILMEISGKQLMTGTLNSIESINTDLLPNGIYVLQLITEDIMECKKIIKN